MTENKKVKMKRMAGKLLRQVIQRKKMLSAEILTSFFGPTVPLMLAVPLARFYTRFFDEFLSYAFHEKDEERARVRLRKVARRDLMLSRIFGAVWDRKDAACVSRRRRFAPIRTRWIWVGVGR